MFSLDFLHCFCISDNYLMVRLPRSFLDGDKKEANVSGPCRDLVWLQVEAKPGTGRTLEGKSKPTWDPCA